MSCNLFISIKAFYYTLRLINLVVDIPVLSRNKIHWLIKRQSITFSRYLNNHFYDVASANAINLSQQCGGQCREERDNGIEESIKIKQPWSIINIIWHKVWHFCEPGGVVSGEICCPYLAGHIFCLGKLQVIYCCGNEIVHQVHLSTGALSQCFGLWNCRKNRKEILGLVPEQK